MTGSIVNPFDDDLTGLTFAAADPGGNSHYIKFRVPTSVDGHVTEWFRTLDVRIAPWNQRSEMNRCFWFYGAAAVGKRVAGSDDLDRALNVYQAQARADALAADIEAGQHFVTTMHDLARAARYAADRVRVREILKDQIGRERVPEIRDELETILHKLEW